MPFLWLSQLSHATMYFPMSILDGCFVDQWWHFNIFKLGHTPARFDCQLRLRPRSPATIYGNPPYSAFGLRLKFAYLILPYIFTQLTNWAFSNWHSFCEKIVKRRWKCYIMYFESVYHLISDKLSSVRCQTSRFI